MPSQAQVPSNQEQMMKVGACMAEIDPAAIENLEAKGDAFGKTMEQLCKAGNKRAAVEQAKQFGLSMASDPGFKAIQACTAGITLPKQSYAIDQSKLNEQDICDRNSRN